MLLIFYKVLILLLIRLIISTVILILIILQVERVRDDLRTAGITPLEEYLPDSLDAIGNCALDINSVQRVTEVWSIDCTHCPVTRELILCQQDRSAQMGTAGRQLVVPRARIQGVNSIISFTTTCTLAKVLRTSCESSIERRHLRRLKINLPRYLFHKGDGQRISIMLYLKEDIFTRYIKK